MFEKRMEGYRFRENPKNEHKKIIDEPDLENYLAKGWDVQTVLSSGKILVTK